MELFQCQFKYAIATQLLQYLQDLNERFLFIYFLCYRQLILTFADDPSLSNTSVALSVASSKFYSHPIKIIDLLKIVVVVISATFRQKIFL